MLAALAHSVRSRSLALPTSSGRSTKATGLGQRRYHKSLKTKSQTNGAGAGGSKDTGSQGGSAGADLSGRKNANTAKKESFDEFFENLMKGQSGGAKPSTTGTSAAPGGVNLDAILSSLSKPSSETASLEQQQEVDARFASIFQKRSAQSDAASSDLNSEAAYLDAGRKVLEKQEDEFAEFMKALKKDYKPSAKSAPAKQVEFPSVVRPFQPKMGELPSELSKVQGEEAVKMVVDTMKKLNPEHVKAAEEKYGIHMPFVSRSELEKQMSETDKKERAALDRAHQEIMTSKQLPIYVTGARVPQASGETRRIDLLAAYEDQDIASMANLALSQEAEQANMSNSDVSRAINNADILSDEDKNLLDGGIDKLFADLADNSKRIEDMQYWALFPTAIKRWLIYTRTPKGFYNDAGQWETLPEPTLAEFLSEEAKTMGLSPEELKSLGRTASIIEEGEEVEALADEAVTETEVDEEAVEITGADGKLEASGLDQVEAKLERMKRLQGAQKVKLEELRVKAAQEAASGTDRSEAEDDIGSEVRKVLDEERQYWEGVYNHEQQYLPEDLQGQYRFHIRAEEMEGMHPKLKRHFSFKFASEGEITKFRSHEYIRKWGKHAGDSGNSAVQIAILTLRINHLSKTLRTNVTDTHNGYRLQILVKRRKALMKHLKRNDLMTYYSLLKDIKLRDQVELWTSMRK